MSNKGLVERKFSNRNNGGNYIQNFLENYYYMKQVEEVLRTPTEFKYVKDLYLTEILGASSFLGGGVDGFIEKFEVGKVVPAVMKILRRFNERTEKILENFKYVLDELVIKQGIYNLNYIYFFLDCKIGDPDGIGWCIGVGKEYFMELINFVQGITLESYNVRSKEEAYQIIAQVLFTMKSLERYNFLHNDPHALNIIIVPNNNPSCYLQYTEFGYSMETTTMAILIDYDHAKTLDENDIEVSYNFNQDFLRFLGYFIDSIECKGKSSNIGPDSLVQFFEDITNEKFCYYESDYKNYFHYEIDNEFDVFGRAVNILEMKGIISSKIIKDYPPRIDENIGKSPKDGILAKIILTGTYNSNEVAMIKHSFDLIVEEYDQQEDPLYKLMYLELIFGFYLVSKELKFTSMMPDIDRFQEDRAKYLKKVGNNIQVDMLMAKSRGYNLHYGEE